MIAYVFSISVLLYLFNKIRSRYPAQKIAYLLIVVLFFLFTVFLNIHIDGNSVNVDRWSAMETSISALLNNQYPYSAADHLNGRSSNLPGLIIIGLPFYYIGNIGILQSFTFLLFAFTIYKSIHNIKAKLLALILLILSISYLWEVYVKSDLISNFIIILSFISLWYLKYQNNKLEKGGLSAGIFSFLLFTRIVSIIPMTLLLFKPFNNSSAKIKLNFVLISVSTMFILGFIVLYNCPDMDFFRNNNPLTLQNRQLPLFISLILIIIPFFYSKKVVSLDSLIKYSLIFLSIPVFVSFAISNIRYGYYDAIINSTYDISYFNIILPFVIYYIAIKYDKYIEDGSKVY